MTQDRRASENPLQHLQGYNVRTDRRHDRRALTADELRRLLAVTAGEPLRFGMAGADRATLYEVAVSTGFRAGELRSLTPESFDLDADPATVIVEAAYSKHRRRDVQPLPIPLAGRLAGYLADRPPAAPVFAMPYKPAKMLRADLQAAGIPYRDGAGCVADFHALRHTFVSNLAAGGVHPKDAQTLARHSTITLTMDRYTHRGVGDVAAALDALPDLTRGGDAREAQRKTGTCDVAASAPDLASGLAFSVATGGFPVSSVGTAKRSTAKNRDFRKRQETGISGTSRHSGVSADTVCGGQAAVGFEPTYNGFAIRPLSPLGYAADFYSQNYSQNFGNRVYSYLAGKTLNLIGASPYVTTDKATDSSQRARRPRRLEIRAGILHP